MPGRRPILSTGDARLLFVCLASVLSVFGVFSAGCGETRLPEEDGSKRTIAAGRTIYERKCASCHGATGNGKTITGSRFKYANLIDGEWRGDGTLASIERQIRKGRDPMPKFEGKLTDEEIRETAAYVLELVRRHPSK